MIFSLGRLAARMQHAGGNNDLQLADVAECWRAGVSALIGLSNEWRHDSIGTLRPESRLGCRRLRYIAQSIYVN